MCLVGLTYVRAPLFCAKGHEAMFVFKYGEMRRCGRSLTNICSLIHPRTDIPQHNLKHNGIFHSKMDLSDLRAVFGLIM